MRIFTLTIDKTLMRAPKIMSQLATCKFGKNFNSRKPLGALDRRASGLNM
jgi:hypothetical protein